MPQTNKSQNLRFLCHYGSVKPNPEMIRSPELFTRFDALLREVLSVPHEEIMRHEAEYKRQSATNPRRPGPKPRGDATDNGS